MADTKINELFTDWLIVGDLPDGRLTAYSGLISPNGHVFDAKTTKAMLELGYISTNVSANKEYVCEYCATANAKENTTCSQCGAPRSFVIG